MADGLSVLFVDDDPAVRHAAGQSLALADLDVIEFARAEDVLGTLHPFFPGVVVTDVRMAGLDGLALLERAVAIDPELPVILITGHGDVAMAVQAMRAGAYDFIEKPFPADQLVAVVRRALEKRRLTFEVQALRRKLDERAGIERSLIGQSEAVEQLRRTIQSLGSSDPDVLILGETGTGKELVAKCLHMASDRRDGHFVALNCGALPETVFDSEIFGHEQGAFTGAQKRRIGKLEHASGGTLFLDEIESMPLAVQVKFLRALQERQIERLGSNEIVPVRLRVVAATKTDLADLCASGGFRSDLYYRLNVVALTIPPLRDRREDVPLLFEHFVLEAAERYGRDAPLPSPDLMSRLMAHGWPGNVRELRNVADRLVLGVLGPPFAAGDARPDAPAGLADQVEAFERSVIVETLRRQDGSVGAASDALGVPRKTLYDKLKRHGISADDYR
ncbi:sigma-54-dependent transcriptional regulator [Marinivivus vitaminiproducens]|uniref:sigma-54-dependent transcriptional regulator n=1 Tax=Marinivivus vitaminiproducens TaxID=3035935 RepID=UPI0027A71DED|nr:sigma-54 dependent transcriptional regulator [Geminicoccaceae bacterium SCSIO 64248]